MKWCLSGYNAGVEGDIERFRELYMPRFDNAVIELDDESLELFDEERILRR